MDFEDLATARTIECCFSGAMDPMSNLLLTLMDKFDVPVAKVGGSNGKVQLDSVAL